MESFWNCNLCCCNLADELLRDECRNILCIRNNGRNEVWIVLFLVIGNGCKDFFKLSLVITCDLFSFNRCDISTPNKCFCIESTSRAFFIDELIHERLRKAWFVTFVMAATSVADHIDYYIFIKFLTIFKCKMCNSNAGFRIISINVEDRGFNHLCNICAVTSSARSNR